MTDQPFYGHYLRATGKSHPHADAIIEESAADWRAQAEALQGQSSDRPQDVWLQLHMAHHLALEDDLSWTDGAVHVVLAEHPRAQLHWLLERTGDAKLEDTGLPHLLALYRRLKERSEDPPLVLTVEQLLASPIVALGAICRTAGIELQLPMLSWEPGARPSDRRWAETWYDLKADGFPVLDSAAELTAAPLPKHFEALVHRCLPTYAELAAASAGSALEIARSMDLHNDLGPMSGSATIDW